MSVKFGIVGLGLIADMHARAIAAMDSGMLTACCDVNPDRTAAFSAAYRCRPYTALDEFLADPEIDVVTVCTPSGLHRDVAVAAAAAGKHLIVEKPLEITVKRCNDIIEAAERNGVLLSGIFPSRFHAASQVIRKAIDQGRFGRIVLADAYVKWFRSQEYYDASGWKGTWSMDGGGALMNQSIHAIDLLQWFAGPVVEVLACTDTLAHERIEVEDTAVAALRFASGALGVIEGSTGAYPGFLKRIEISGSRGSVIMEEEDILVWDFAEPREEDSSVRQEFARRTQSGGGASDPAAIGFHGHQYQFENVVRAIEGKEPLLVDGHEARKAVEIICAVYESAARQSRVIIGGAS